MTSRRVWSEKGSRVDRRIVWHGPEAGLNRMLLTNCPHCGQEALVDGTTIRFLIAPHAAPNSRAICLAFDAEIHRRLPRLRTWKESR